MQQQQQQQQPFVPQWARRAATAHLTGYSRQYHATTRADFTLADPIAADRLVSEDRTCAVRVASGRIVNIGQLYRMLDEQLDAIDNGR